MSRVSFNRADLASALSRMAGVVERSAIPVLNNIHVAVSKGRASITATDMSLWLSTEIAVDHEAITAFTLPADLFSAAATKLEGERLTLDLRDGRADLSSGRAKVNIGTLPVDGFPFRASQEQGRVPAIVKASDFAAALSAGGYAFPDGPGTKYAEGVHFEAGSLNLTISSTSGTRLATATAQNLGGEFDGFLLPVKAARLIAKLAQDAGNADVEVRSGERSALISVGDWHVVAGLVDGSLPDFSSKLEERNGEPIMFDPRELDRALGRLGLIADQYSQGVRFELSADTLNLSLSNQKIGSASEEVPVGYEGKPQTLGFSLAFLRAALRQIDGDDAEMWIGSDPKLAVIMARGEATSAHLIGPFKV